MIKVFIFKFVFHIHIYSYVYHNIANDGYLLRYNICIFREFYRTKFTEVTAFLNIKKCFSRRQGPLIIQVKTKEYLSQRLNLSRKFRWLLCLFFWGVCTGKRTIEERECNYSVRKKYDFEC